MLNQKHHQINLYHTNQGDIMKLGKICQILGFFWVLKKRYKVFLNSFDI